MAFNAIPLVLGAGSALGSFLAREEADEAAREATERLTSATQTATNRLGTAAAQGAAERIQGLQTARGDIQAGTGQAIGEQRDALQRALERTNPELLSARGAQNLLNDALGVNGPEAQQQFFTQFQDDPGFQAELQDRINAVDRSAAARGQLLSGRTLEEVGTTGQRFRRGAFTDRLNRLASAARPAASIAQSGANMITGTGANIGNALLGQGRNLADISARIGQAEAARIENPAQIGAQGTLDIGNALARQRLTEGANFVNMMNNLNAAAGQAAGAFGPQGFNPFAGGQVPLNNIGQSQVGPGGLPPLQLLRT